jgi:hypothetical protein
LLVFTKQRRLGGIGERNSRRNFFWFKRGSELSKKELLEEAKWVTRQKRKGEGEKKHGLEEKGWGSLIVAFSGCQISIVEKKQVQRQQTLLE